MRVLVAGANGFLGRAVCAGLATAGHTVLALVRDPSRARGAFPPGTRVIGWSPPALAGPIPPARLGAFREELRETDAVVNLTGEPVVGRFSEQHRARLRASRLGPTQALVQAMAPDDDANTRRPRILVQGSAVGFYGETDHEVDESSPAGSDFLARLVADWEAAARVAEASGVRVVLLRVGVVLGRGGGALAKMLPLFKLGLGGPLGSGRQWMPWVALADVVGLVDFALGRADLSGPLNVVGPEAVTQGELAKTLGRVLHRPAILPTPAAAVRLVFGAGADLVLTGQRVFPRRAVELDYAWHHPTLEGALEAAISAES
jgi:uncharacterized protein (TIGR01777 family)